MSSKRLPGFLALACLLAWPAWAADYKPYPDAEITVEQWQDYFDIVQNELGATREDVPDAKLVLFTDDARRTFYAFTLPDHPAHPAWITRKVVEVDGSVSLEQIGYFAGTETPFAALFQDYLDLSDKIRDEIVSPENEEADQ